LLVLGAIRTGGGGCNCPANTLAKRVVSHLSGEADILMMDMEAGVEHLGRGTTRSAQALLVIVEPGVKSVETAFQIAKMANDLGIPRLFGVINKLRSGDDPGLIAKRLAEAGVSTIFAFPYDPTMEVADRTGVPVIDLPEGENMKAHLLELAGVIEKYMLNQDQVSQGKRDGTAGY
ncbi:MAG: hypothetical protein NTV68_14905, partial [Methanomicrobiales archaeon]|nr:hypothetical protein [Methanomicrobiales archaeon]